MTEDVVPDGDKLNRVISDNIRYVRDSARLSSGNVPGINKASNEDESDQGDGGCRVVLPDAVETVPASDKLNNIVTSDNISSVSDSA